MGVPCVLISATCFEGQCSPPPTGWGGVAFQGPWCPSPRLRAGLSRRGKFAVSAARGWKRRREASVPLFSPVCAGTLAWIQLSSCFYPAAAWLWLFGNL